MPARSISAEESALVVKDVVKDVSARSQSAKREWPRNLVNVLIFFMLLGSGVFIGVFMCSHMPRYLRFENMFYDRSTGDSGVREEPMKLEQWIRPPTNLLHNMTDEELFWRASTVPRREGYPFKRVSKVAFMFLTKGPLPLSPLWEKFFRGHRALYSIYVHSLPSYKGRPPPTSVFYRRQIPSQVAEWGRMSMCDAERRLLANALLDFSNIRFILLSEACIPVYNFSTVYNYLINSQHSFVGAFDDPGPNGRGRYSKNMEPEVSLAQWRKGSQWFEVHRELAVNIISDNLYYPKFKRFCTPACYVDEHYFPTILSIHFGSIIANRSITWVDWSRGGPHPAMFGKGDVTEDFIKKIQNGSSCTYNNQPTSLCFLFARKFSPSALEPLLHLSSKVMGFS